MSIQHFSMQEAVRGLPCLSGPHSHQTAHNRTPRKDHFQDISRIHGYVWLDPTSYMGYLVQVGSGLMQVFVIDGVLQAAALLVHLAVLGQLLTLLIQLSQALLQLSNLDSMADHD